MNEEPLHAPYCCGVRAKWVVQTPSLAYFYCETCKTEPDAKTKQLPFSGYSDWGGTKMINDQGVTKSTLAPINSRLQEQVDALKDLYSPPLPTGSTPFKKGDRFTLKWSHIEGTVTGVSTDGTWVDVKLDSGYETSLGADEIRLLV